MAVCTWHVTRDGVDIGSVLQDPALLAINGFAVPAAKLAEKRKLIEEIAHNDVKKVSRTPFDYILENA